MELMIPSISTFVGIWCWNILDLQFVGCFSDTKLSGSRSRFPNAKPSTPRCVNRLAKRLTLTPWLEIFMFVLLFFVVFQSLNQSNISNAET